MDVDIEQGDAGSEQHVLTPEDAPDHEISNAAAMEVDAAAEEAASEEQTRGPCLDTPRAVAVEADTSTGAAASEQLLLMIPKAGEASVGT